MEDYHMTLLMFLNVFCKHIFSSSYIKDTFKIMAEITSKSYHIQNRKIKSRILQYCIVGSSIPSTVLWLCTAHFGECNTPSRYSNYSANECSVCILQNMSKIKAVVRSSLQLQWDGYEFASLLNIIRVRNALIVCNQFTLNSPYSLAAKSYSNGLNGLLKIFLVRFIAHFIVVSWRKNNICW